MNIMHLFSLLAEIIVTAMGIKLGLDKKVFGWYLSLTFAIYVLYDFSRFVELRIPPFLLDTLFLIASISILLGSYSLLTPTKSHKKK